MAERLKGTVKWFNNAKGYGFLGRDDGPDVFIHYSSITTEGYKSLQEGDKVEMARRMNTSRAALDRLLDPVNASVTLQTLCRAARAIGRDLRIELV